MPACKMREGSAFQDGGNLQYAFNVRMQSTSYSWWDDGRVDGHASQERTSVSTLTIRGPLLISQTEETVFGKPSLQAITGTTEVVQPATPSTPKTPW